MSPLQIHQDLVIALLRHHDVVWEQVMESLGSHSHQDDVTQELNNRWDAGCDMLHALAVALGLSDNGPHGTYDVFVSISRLQDYCDYFDVVVD